MVFVIVQHFLTQEGKIFFPSWCKEATQILTPFSGFMGIEPVQKVGETGTFLYLRFRSYQELQIWATSTAHEALLQRLLPYQIQKQQSQIFTLDDETILKKT